MELTRERMLDFIDRVRTHFVDEGRQRSVSPETGNCVYHGPNGTHCAFALILPEDLRNILKKYEGKRANVVIQKEPKIAEFLGVTKDTKMFFTHLQMCHDNNSGSNTIKRALDVMVSNVNGGFYD